MLEEKEKVVRTTSSNNIKSSRNKKNWMSEEKNVRMHIDGKEKNSRESRVLAENVGNVRK